MVGDIYRYTYQQIRVYLQVHLAPIASIDSYSNSCGVDCTERRVYSLGLLGWVRPYSIGPLIPQPPNLTLPNQRMVTPW